MPTFEAYENAMAAALKTVAGIDSVDEYAAALDAAALKKVAPRNAGLVIVPLGGQPDRAQPSTGQLAFSCRTGAFIVSRNARGATNRSIAARTLARNVMLFIHQNHWGLADTHAAVIEKLENRSSGAADKAGYAVWLVVWKQTIYLDLEPVDTSVVPTAVFASRAPDIGVGHVADYQQVDTSI